MRQAKHEDGGGPQFVTSTTLRGMSAIGSKVPNRVYSDRTADIQSLSSKADCLLMAAFDQLPTLKTGNNPDGISFRLMRSPDGPLQIDQISFKGLVQMPSAHLRC
jgi:hypothetical protein